MRWAVLALAGLLALPGSAQATNSVIVSRHFMVIFKYGETSRVYARSILKDLEHARSKLFGSLGYKIPSWMPVYPKRLPVYVQKLSLKTLGFARFNHASKRAQIRVNLKKTISDRELLRATAGHEFFHLVQFGYSLTEPAWLYEATAAWIEDKLYHPAKTDWNSYGYLYYLSTWMKHPNRSLNHFGGNHQYAAAFFFQYLTERKPGGLNVVRKIWEKAAAVAGNNGYAAIGQVLGDPGAWGPKTLARVADTAATSVIRWPSRSRRYSLAKLEGNPRKVPDATFPVGSMLAPATGSGGLLKNLSLPLDPIGSLPLALSVGTNWPVDNPDMLVLAQGMTDAHWSFRLIQATPSGAWRVRKLDTPHGVPARVHMTRICNGAVAAKQVVLDAVRMSGTSRSDFRATAALRQPLVIQELEFLEPGANGEETVWKLVRKRRNHAWETRIDPARGLRYKRGKQGKLRLQTNRKFKGKVQLALGGGLYGQKKITLNFDGQHTKAESSFPLDLLFAYMPSIQPGGLPLELEVHETLKLAASIPVAGAATAPAIQIDLPGWDGQAVTGCGAEFLSIPVDERARPPFLQRVRVFQIGDPIYDAEWQPVQARGDHPASRKLEKILDEALDPTGPARIELEFSSPVGADSLQVRLAGEPLEVSPMEDPAHFEAVVESHPEAWAAPEGEVHELPLQVEAIGEDEFKLDADPETKVSWDSDEANWIGWESRPQRYAGKNGGPDLWHTLHTGKPPSDQYLIIEQYQAAGRRFDIVDPPRGQAPASIDPKAIRIPVRR